ncbi:DNA repair protein recA homolog 2, mitochondrial isoform X2 [Typha angustifolia]|uniref:DNA repair protein recA homolog 2, mitochondrial isoform X2 n=1 Tax=Typha angustifolia TaxID=59011 RepID=UPI003C2D482C
MRALSFSITSSLLRAVRLSRFGGQTSPLPSIRQVLRRDIIYLFESKSRCLSSTVEMLSEYERDQLFDDGKRNEKESALNLAISQLAGDFDRESNLSLGRFLRPRHTSVITTGSLKLDLALGIGGLPKGRMVEIYGKEASGKTTLALHIVKEAQKLGGYCAYLDVENSLDPSFVEDIGVDTGNLLIARPDSAENSLSIVNTLVNSGSVDVIIVDSVAALVPECELNGMIDINSHDVQSHLMTQALRKIHYSLSRSHCLLIFINQIRTKLRSSQGFGENSEVTCGGNALKFYAAIRMRISRRGLIHNEDKVTGLSVSVQIMKNKLAPAMRKANLDIRFGRGICHEAEVLEMASSRGIIVREENGYWMKGKFFEDQLEAEQFLVENSAVTDELVGVLREQLFEMTS